MPWNLFPTKRPSISRTTIDLLFLFGLMVLFYGQPFLNPSCVSYGGDGFSLFLPALDHYRLSMYSGHIPLWNPYTWMGSPFLAPFQASVLYPIQLLSLSFGTPAEALNFGIFISIVWLAFGSYIFGLRALELERFPSLLMGIAMSCSAFIGAHSDHINQIAAVSWIPWIMCEALLLLRWPRIRHMILLSLCLSMQVFAGHPQYVTYTLAYLVALSACYFVYLYHRRRTDDPPAWLGIAMLALAVAIGFGLASAQLLPSAELAQMSVRQIDAPDRMFNYSYPPRHLLTMVLPNAYGNPVTGLHDLFSDKEYPYNFSEFTSYIGLITLVFAATAVFTLFQEFAVRAFLLLALISLSAAFGEYVWHGIPYQMAMMMLPGGSHLRAPARFLIFFNLSVAVLAAMGFNQLFFYLSERRRIRPTTLAPLRILVLVLVLGDLYWFSHYCQSFRFNKDNPTEILKNTGPVWKFFADQNPGAYKVFRQMDEVPYTMDENQIGVSDFREAKVFATTQQLQRLQPNLNMLAHVQTCAGYEEGLLPTLSWLNSIGYNLEMQMTGQYYRNLFSPTPDTQLMGLFNIKYIATDKPLFGPRLKFLFASPGFENTGRLSRYAVYENLDCKPKFVWGKELRTIYDLDVLDVDPYHAQRLQSITEQKFNYTYMRKKPLVLEGRPTSAPTPVDFRQILGSPNGYLLTKTKSDKGELIMAESAYPGWVCRMNGEVVPMRRINPFMMGWFIPDGVEKFTISFEPFSFRLGLFLSCMFAMLICGAAVFHDRPRNPRLRRRS